MTDRILEVKNLTKTFCSHNQCLMAVDQVSFFLNQGECLGIVGESGSGKSTLAKMITRLTDPSRGEIYLMGKDITHMRGRELREAYRHMQMVFQMPVESFDPRHTLGSGIGESLRNQGMNRREARKKVEELLVSCGLTADFADRYPHEIIGGQSQRAAIARAFEVQPSVLICDEATSALDVTVQKQILELLLELKKTNKLSFIFISHDLALVQAICDRVLVMYDGKIVEEGTPEDIIDNPKEAYTQLLVDSVL